MARLPRSQPYYLNAPITGSQVENLNQMLQELYDDIRNGAIDLSTGTISGTLPVEHGGTNKTSYTAGSVIFAGAGGLTLTEDNANFFWDFTNIRLGLKTNTPDATLTVNGGVHVLNGGDFVVNSTNSAIGKSTAVNVRTALVIGGGDPTGTTPDLTASVGGLVGLDLRTAMQALSGDNSSHAALNVLPVSVADGTPRTLSAQYGVRIRSESNDPTLTVTDAYGLYVDGPTTAGNNYAAYFGGLVGVNTPAPQRTLHVVGPDGPVAVFPTLSAQNMLVLENNSSSNLAFVGNPASDCSIGWFASGATTPNGRIIYSLGSDAFLFRLTGGEKMRITTAGNVGINTTAPQNYGTNYRTLEVLGGTTSTGGIFQSSSSDSSVKARLFVDSTAGFTGTSTAHDFFVQTNGATVATFKSGGNVGIGITNPATKLVVSNAGAEGMEINPSGGNVVFQLFNRNTSAYVASFWDALSIRFRTGTSPVDAMIIDSAKNIGVGTTAPDVTGYGSTVVTIQNASAEGILELTSARADADDVTVGELTFLGTHNGTTSAGRTAVIRSRTAGTTANNRGGDLRFLTKADAGALTERMRIGNAGQITIANVITTYNNIATEGYGVPAIVDSVALTAQTADIGSTNISNANVAGQYEVEYYLEATSADITAGTVTLTFSFTDDAGATTVASSALVLTATGRTSGRFPVRLASGNLSYATAHTGIFGTSAYALYITTKRLS